MCECFINIHLACFFLTCVNALPACMFVYHELACCPVRADEGVRSYGRWWATTQVLGTESLLAARGASAPNY